jgi:hypothetical protein
MVVGFTTIYLIIGYHHYICEFEPRSWRGVLDTTLCDKVSQWFSSVTPVFSANKTNHHDITEILFKVALNTIIQTKPTAYYKKNGREDPPVRKRR